MPHDDEDDLFVDDFDFVDDDDDDDETVQEEQAEVEEKKPEPQARPKRKSSSRGGRRGSKPRASAELKDAEAEEKSEAEESEQSSTASEEESDSKAEEPKKPEEPPALPTDHVVHVYEHGEFVRTIAREFTSEDAEAFATEYNRTSAAHSRAGVAGNKEEKPAPSI